MSRRARWAALVLSTALAACGTPAGDDGAGDTPSTGTPSTGTSDGSTGTPETPAGSGGQGDGQVDGSPGTTGGSDGASTTTPPQASLADGFESAALDGARWTVLGAEGHQQPQATTAVVDQTRAHSGTRSVKIHDGFLEAKTPATAFYTRAWVWLAADPGTGHWMSFVGVGPGGQQGTEVRYGGHYGILEANYFGNDDEQISDPKGYCAPTCDNGVTLPVGRWTCVETYFGKDELRLWLDGQEVDTLHVTAWRNQPAPWSPAYDRVRLGFHDFQGEAVDLWLDDVALGESRLGCD